MPAVAAVDRLYAEALIGRPLRPAEHAIDILGLDRAMNDAKDELERAIKDEQRKAVKRAIRLGAPVRLRVTREMLRPLERLYDLGRREGALELERAGYQSVRRFEEAEFRRDPLELRIGDLFRRALARVGLRVDRELLEVDLSEASTAAIARALMSVPGARDLASQVISTAVYTGLGQTFEANEGLVGGWEVTAVLDSGTCPPCAEHDGMEFDTWAAAQALLPDGGPAVYCDGGGRCRCRLVPLPAG